MKASFILWTALISISVSGCGLSAKREDSSTFIVHQKIELHEKTDGIDGSLEILRDRRLAIADIAQLALHEPEVKPANLLIFSQNPLKQARLELKSLDGRILSSLELDKLYAEIEIIPMHRLRRAIVVTQDFGSGLGSYSGPISQIIEVSRDRLQWAEARSQSGMISQISLMRSLKSAWSLDTHSDAHDILAVSCRPDANFSSFVTSYLRYHFDGGVWTVTSRSENEMWEAEDGDQKLGSTLPEITKFPAVTTSGASAASEIAL